MPFDGSRFDDQASAPSMSLARRVLARFIQFPAEQARGASPLEVANLLWDARELIEAEKHWLRGAYHRPPAQFCAMGALHRASRKASHAALIRAHGLLLDVARGGGFPTVEQMNDRTSHEFVLAAFDRAISAGLS